MAGRIIYLEVDDEITSAAARIRGSEATQLAVVLPYGSRVATSRINFRLLTRDALEHEKRLSIVSGDPATRALAASAGLPVFASVSEYESSVAGSEDEARPGTAVPVVGPATAAGAGMDAAATDAPDVREVPESDGTLGLVAPAAGLAGAAVAASHATSLASPPGDTIRTSIPRGPSTLGERDSVEPGSRLGGPGGPVSTARGSWRGGTRTPWLIGGAILALALLVGGTGVYLLLPSASIVVSPRQEPLGPVQMVITADTTATQPDANARVIPATKVNVPVSVNNTFDATGKRVQLTNATGTVRFDNLNPTSTNRVASGSIVRTASGMRFRTAVETNVPRAQLLQIEVGRFVLTPGKATVRVTAVDGGPGGNVDANTIVVVPNGENSQFLKVTNPEATSGGARQDFARITQADVDGAMAALDTSLHEAFTEALANPALVSGGATVFPATGTLGTTKPTLDPATLVGQEIATFDLGLSATGTVITADTTPINGIADTQLRAAVKPDHELVAGSAGITVGGAVVTGQTVTFPVTATAKQVALLDPGTLKAKVLGKSVADAKAILSQYGDVRLSVSPDWTGSVPSFESRVDLTVQGAVPVETPGPSSPSGSSTP